MRAWIEILQSNQEIVDFTVALFVSAWIEIWYNVGDDDTQLVALFVSAWIEILGKYPIGTVVYCRTLCECVD